MYMYCIRDSWNNRVIYCKYKSSRFIKFMFLQVLGDIELAQGLQKEKKPKAESVNEVPHPLDVDYMSLKAKLEHVKTSDDDYKVINKYLNATMPSYQKLEIIDVWRVDRDDEVLCMYRKSGNFRG